MCTYIQGEVSVMSYNKVKVWAGIVGIGVVFAVMSYVAYLLLSGAL